MTKTIYSLFFGLTLGLGLSPSVFAQTPIVTNNFETCESGYTEYGGHSDNSSDYFVRTDGSSSTVDCGSVTNPSGDLTFSSTSGFYYTGEDMNTSDNPNLAGGAHGSAANSGGVFFNDIDVSSYSNVQIVLSVAASTSSAFENANDYLRIYVDKTNSGAWTLVGAFESVNGLGNQLLSQDTDLNGSGDGTALGLTFQAFTFDVTGATTMDVRIEMANDGGSEEIAFDTFIVQGDATTWNGSTWSNGTPNATTAAIIASSTTPGTDITCEHLTINSGITLNMGSNNLTIGGNLVNNGNGISSTGTITFNESGTAAISGNAVSHGGVVSVSSGTTLSTGGLLTLTASSASSFGQLVGDGTVSGNVNVQAYLDGINASTARYFYLGSPCTDAALSDFNEGNIMVASNSSTGTTWEWDASSAIWTAPSNLSNTATNGRGYAIYAGTNTFGTFIRGTAGTIQLTGSVPTTDVGRAVSYHNGQGFPVNGQGSTQTFVGGTSEADTEGWNLVANPYPAVYDWFSQSVPSNMASAIYRFDGTNYTSYTIGVNSSSRYIAPFQAFFVQLTTNVAGTLTFSENQRVTGQSATLGKKSSYTIDGVDLYIHNQSNSAYDHLFIGYDSQASLGFDLELDARKLLNVYGVPNIFTRFGDNTYSICRVNKYDGMTSFPVYLEHYIDGEQMAFNIDLSRLQSYGTVKLEDLKTGNVHDLGSSDYHFVNDTSFHGNRFVLHFAANHSVGISETELSNAWFTYNAENGINVNTGNLQNAEITVYNLSGQIVYKTNASEQITNIALSNKGVYMVTVDTENSSSSKKIIH